MRTRETLILCNIKDLTLEERAALADMGLSFCDNCGEIDIDDYITWLNNEDFKDDIAAQSLLLSGIISLDKKCFVKMKDKIAQCGSCEDYFIVDNDDKDCPHCHSMNWVYGCIDDPDPACFNCKGREDCQLECYQDCQYNPENEEEDTLPEE